MQGRYDSQRRLYVTFSAPVIGAQALVVPAMRFGTVAESVSIGDFVAVTVTPRSLTWWERARNAIDTAWGQAWDFLNRPLFPGLATRLMDRTFQ